MKKYLTSYTILISVLGGYAVNRLVYYLYGSHPNPGCPAGLMDCSSIVQGWPFADPGPAWTQTISVNWYFNLIFWILISYVIVVLFVKITKEKLVKK
jgi:hypothetical protein